MEGLSQTINIISGGLLFLHIMSYSFLLDNNKLAILLEILKIILGIVLLYLVNNDWYIISDLILIIIYSYFFISLGITIYFFNKDRTILQLVNAKN